LFPGNVSAGEREFLISPEYGHAVMNAMGAHVSESRSQVKKAFDWMSEEQFHNLQVILNNLTLEVNNFLSFIYLILNYIGSL